MTIEHIILPGGGPIGIYVFGALKRLNEINFWKIENIKSIYCIMKILITGGAGFVGSS